MSFADRLGISAWRGALVAVVLSSLAATTQADVIWLSQHRTLTRGWYGQPTNWSGGSEPFAELSTELAADFGLFDGSVIGPTAIVAQGWSGGGYSEPGLTYYTATTDFMSMQVRFRLTAPTAYSLDMIMDPFHNNTWRWPIGFDFRLTGVNVPLGLAGLVEPFHSSGTLPAGDYEFYAATSTPAPPGYSPDWWDSYSQLGYDINFALDVSPDAVTYLPEPTTLPLLAILTLGLLRRRGCSISVPI